MKDKNLDEWFFAQEVYRFWLNNLVGSRHDVDDDMPDTDDRCPYIFNGEDVADPDSFKPFDAIRFASEEHETAAVIGLMQDRSIEPSGKFYSSAELENLTHIEDEDVDDPVLAQESETKDDFGPQTISGRRLVYQNKEHRSGKKLAEATRLSRAKTSGLKQNHRRQVVDLPMLASQIEI
jgi:hypothetical protein